MVFGLGDSAAHEAPPRAHYAIGQFNLTALQCSELLRFIG